MQRGITVKVKFFICFKNPGLRRQRQSRFCLSERAYSQGCKSCMRRVFRHDTALGRMCIYHLAFSCYGTPRKRNRVSGYTSAKCVLLLKALKVKTVRVLRCVSPQCRGLLFILAVNRKLALEINLSGHADHSVQFLHRVPIGAARLDYI